jgi:hypothetical protein
MTIASTAFHWAGAAIAYFSFGFLRDSAAPRGMTVAGTH